MSSLASLTYFLLLFPFFKYATAGKAATFYCDFGFCVGDQYCCGDNKCCDKLLDLWYFWLGLGIVIVVVALIIFLKFYLRKRRPPSYKYQKVEQTLS